MAYLPGAIIKTVARFTTPRTRDRGVVLHIAVSDGASLFNYFNTPGNPCSHFYVRKSGNTNGMADFEQYVDTKYIAPAQLEGNPTMIGIETQGGVGDDLNAGWTATQLERLAWIVAQCSLLHPGIPLTAIPDSLPASNGIGYHRLGVDPWRMAGGELWSRSYGKVCPGPARMKQIPYIIERARRIAAGDDIVTPDDVETIAQRSAAVLLTKIIKTFEGQEKKVEDTFREASYANDALAATQNLKPQLDRIEALAATPFDIAALADAIVAKLPAGALTVEQVQAACDAAIRVRFNLVDGD